MSNQLRPKALVFDIGGVCVSVEQWSVAQALMLQQVVSPFQAIIDYEVENKIPKGYINFAISASKPNGSWHKAERGEVLLDKAWFKAFKADIERPSTWERYHKEKLRATTVPPLPSVDSEKLYWTMMSTAQAADPYMAPALKKLKASGKFHLAALSNTTIFPDGHEYNNIGEDDVRRSFSIFVSSAHVGMRKPNRDIYEYTMKQLQKEWPEDHIEAKDVVFLDDIGENLKMGKQVGWRTIKVLLGRTDEAVKELERITGLDLLEADKRISSKL